MHRPSKRKCLLSIQKIKGIVSNCSTCLDECNQQPAEQIIQICHEISDIPWTKIGTDIFELVWLQKTTDKMTGFNFVYSKLTEVGRVEKKKIQSLFFHQVRVRRRMGWVCSWPDDLVVCSVMIRCGLVGCQRSLIFDVTHEHSLWYQFWCQLPFVTFSWQFYSCVWERNWLRKTLEVSLWLVEKGLFLFDLTWTQTWLYGTDTHKK